jgi:DNA/RNA-binding domain of Phe-tRNA-synthetase-like protein
VNFSVAPELAAIVRPGVLWLDGATVVERDLRMDDRLAAAEAAVRSTPPEEMVAVRTMYKRVGLDPTKRRPSSEALLRRVR